MPLELLTVPATDTPTALVVWLHGLGASGDDFVPVVPLMGLPHVHWVFPNAPDMPVTINSGYVMPSWYDIRTMDPGPEREDIDQLRESANAVDLIISEQLAAYDISDERVVIAGFSQGGAVTTELLTQGRRRFAGGVILSSYWATPDPQTATANDVNAATPIFFGHGRHDGVVPMPRGRATYDRLLALGRPVEWRDYPIGHEVRVDELQHIRAALHRWIG